MAKRRRREKAEGTQEQGGAEEKRAKKTGNLPGGANFSVRLWTLTMSFDSELGLDGNEAQANQDEEAVHRLETCRDFTTFFSPKSCPSRVVDKDPFPWSSKANAFYVSIDTSCWHVARFVLGDTCHVGFFRALILADFDSMTISTTYSRRNRLSADRLDQLMF